MRDGGIKNTDKDHGVPFDPEQRDVPLTFFVLRHPPLAPAIPSSDILQHITRSGWSEAGMGGAGG